MDGMTSTRCLWIGLCLLAMACDAARGGPYEGNFPAPVQIHGLAETGGFFTMSFFELRNHRRWRQTSTQMAAGRPSYAVTDSRDLWLALADCITNAVYSTENYAGPVACLSVPTGIPEIVYAVTDGSIETRPSGPGGPSVNLEPGFHALYRTCRDGVPNYLEEVAPDTPVAHNAQAAASQAMGVDPHLQSCGIQVAPSIELGDKVASAQKTAGYCHVADLAWNPSSDIVYVLADDGPGVGIAQLRSYQAATHVQTILDSGFLYPPLLVANGGSTLLATQAVRNSGRTSWVSQTRIPRDNMSVPTRSALPLSRTIQRGSDPVWGQCPHPGALSPDGNTLAVSTSEAARSAVIQLLDVATGLLVATLADPGLPLLWDSSGHGLLVMEATSSGVVRYVPVDAASEMPARAYPAAPFSIRPGYCPQDPAQHHLFWSAGGPKVLVQDDEGAGVHDFASGIRTTFVDAQHVAPPSTSVDAVVAKEQVFAWAMRCFGLGETSCTSELRRLSIATGTIETVATADGAYPFAVSPDGAKLAIAYKGDLYLKTLAP